MILALLNFVRAEKSALGDAGHAPILCHCSAGVGRTGTVIMVDQAMDQLDNTGKVDPVALVREIRKGRYNLVQRTAQYKLAWQACINYTRGLLQARPRGGTIMSIASDDESGMSSKMSAKLRRQSMAKTGDWDVQYIDGTELFMMKADAQPVRIEASDIELQEQRAPKITIGPQHVGLAVSVSGYTCPGRLRFVGEHTKHKTPRVGVELDEAVGKNDGTVGGHAYFSCLAGHGVLCVPNKVQLLDVQQDLAVGMRCCVLGYPSLGTIQFLGNHHITGSARCGVELDAEVGNNDGIVRGRRYFNSSPNCGVLVAPVKIKTLRPAVVADVGKRVVVRGYGCHGTLQFVGMHHKKQSPRVGVELEAPLGKNDRVR